MSIVSSTPFTTLKFFFLKKNGIRFTLSYIKVNVAFAKVFSTISSQGRNRVLKSRCSLQLFCSVVVVVVVVVELWYLITHQRRRDQWSQSRSKVKMDSNSLKSKTQEKKMMMMKKKKKKICYIYNNWISKSPFNI